MRTLTAIAFLALLSVTFAGCAEDSERYPDGVPTTSSSRSRTSTSGTATTSSSTTTSTGPSQANNAPTGAISVAVNGSVATFNLTGSDPDGDPVTWTLTFGDGNATNGTALPTSVPHNYTATGNFSVNYTLSDGTNSTSYPFNVTIGGAGGGTSVVITGSTSQPGNPTTSAVAGANGCLGFSAGENGVDCVFGEIPAGLDGKPFVFAASTGGPDYELWDACDPTGSPVQEFGGPSEGVLPPGVGCVIMWEYGVGTGTFTFTVGS